MKGNIYLSKCDTVFVVVVVVVVALLIVISLAFCANACCARTTHALGGLRLTVRTATQSNVLLAGGRGRKMNNSANQLPLDEQPIATRDHGQRRVGASPDARLVESSGRYGGGSEAGGADDPQGSPPKAKPRILHSAEGLRAHPSREDFMVLTR